VVPQSGRGSPAALGKRSLSTWPMVRAAETGDPLRDGRLPSVAWSRRSSVLLAPGECLLVEIKELLGDG
jgi:hypothetical protein